MVQLSVPDALPNECGRLQTKTDGAVVQSSGDLENQDIGVALCNIAALAGTLTLKNPDDKLKCGKVSLVFSENSYSLTYHGAKFVYSKVATDGGE